MAAMQAQHLADKVLRGGKFAEIVEKDRHVKVYAPFFGGRSRRMGRPKPLVPIDGTPMLLSTIEPLLATPGLRVVVVVSGDVDERLGLAERGVIVARNDDPEAEMIDSVRAGVRAGLALDEPLADYNERATFAAGFLVLRLRDGETLRIPEASG